MRQPVEVIEGFDYAPIEIGETRYRPGTAGSGPAVLLLHGFPQTHYCWHRVAPGLADDHTVVVCDLKGYGESRGAPAGPQGEGYSNRDRAAELVALMRQLGHESFAVVGHDRGARVSYRMALDHPDAVERLVVLNIVPTLDQFEGEATLAYWPWFLLAQPAPFPERVVGASADFILRDIFATWPATPIDPEPYLQPFAESLPGICADYRASFHIDRGHDRDQQTRFACPVLVHWGGEEEAMAGPLDVWRRWADDLRGSPLPCGHFIPEEVPDELLASLRAFLA